MTLVDVVLVETGFGPCAIVPVGLVDVAFLGPDPEGGRFVVGEVERGDGDLVRLDVGGGVLEFEGFLRARNGGIELARERREAKTGGRELDATHLRLSEHVREP